MACATPDAASARAINGHDAFVSAARNASTSSKPAAEHFSANLPLGGHLNEFDEGCVCLQDLAGHVGQDDSIGCLCTVLRPVVAGLGVCVAPRPCVGRLQTQEEHESTVLPEERCGEKHPLGTGEQFRTQMPGLPAPQHLGRHHFDRGLRSGVGYRGQRSSDQLRRTHAEQRARGRIGVEHAQVLRIDDQQRLGGCGEEMVVARLEFAQPGVVALHGRLRFDQTRLHAGVFIGRRNGNRSLSASCGHSRCRRDLAFVQSSGHGT